MITKQRFSWCSPPQWTSVKNDPFLWASIRCQLPRKNLIVSILCLNSSAILLPPLLIQRCSHTGKESQRPVAHECLGEVLRNLRQVINTYPLLNTVEILTAAGKLISKVKGELTARRSFSSARLRENTFSASSNLKIWTIFRFPLWGV